MLEKGGVFSWLQSATSLLDATKSYTLVLKEKNRTNEMSQFLYMVTSILIYRTAVGIIC